MSLANDLSTTSIGLIQQFGALVTFRKAPISNYNINSGKNEIVIGSSISKRAVIERASDGRIGRELVEGSSFRLTVDANDEINTEDEFAIKGKLYRVLRVDPTFVGDTPIIYQVWVGV